MEEYIDEYIVEKELRRRASGNCLLCERYFNCIDNGLNRKGSHAHCWKPLKFSPADVQEVKHGEWKESDFIAGLLSCSKCGAQRNPNFKIGLGAWNFCPNCGARMDGEPE